MSADLGSKAWLWEINSQLSTRRMKMPLPPRAKQGPTTLKPYFCRAAETLNPLSRKFKGFRRAEGYEFLNSSEALVAYLPGSPSARIPGAVPVKNKLGSKVCSLGFWV